MSWAGCGPTRPSADGCPSPCGTSCGPQSGGCRAVPGAARRGGGARARGRSRRCCRPSTGRRRRARRAGPALDDGVLDPPRAASGCASPTTSSARACSPTSPRPSRPGCTSRRRPLEPLADDPDVSPSSPTTRSPRSRAATRPPPTGWARRAAEVAHTRLAYDEAARLLRAAASTPDGPCCRPGERAELLIAAAHAHAAGERLAGAIATCAPRPPTWPGTPGTRSARARRAGAAGSLGS